MNLIVQRALAVTSLIDRLQPAAFLALRLYVSSVFLRSGWIKVTDWSGTIALFHDEYTVPVLPPDVAAYVGTFGELIFPVLIILGLAGRFGSAGLFVVNVMAVVSYPQLFTFECPAGINAHFYWGTILAALVIYGSGKWSADEVILRHLGLAKRANP